MGEIIRQVQGQLKILESKSNKKLYRVEIMALNSEVNRNHWKYINLEKHLDEFKNIPLLTAYLPNGKVGDGHNFDVAVNPLTGEEYCDYTAPDAERIVGWVDENDSIRIENIDGIDWIVVTASLWSWYNQPLVEKIARQGCMSVSIETLVTKEHREEDYDVEEEYIVLGITILGDGVAPAVSGANIRNLAALSELREAMRNDVLKAASFNGNEEKEEDEPEAKPDDEDMESNKEPKKSQTGVNKQMEFSKKQLEELTPLFGTNKVLGALKDDNGIHVALLTAEGACATYTMGSLAEAIVPERIEKVNAKATFEFSEDCILAVDASEFAVETSVKKDLEAQLETAKADLAKANATIEAMQTAENKRRVQACKDIAVSALNSFNADSEIKVDEKVLEAINSDIEGGVFTNSVNANGEWDGDAKVRDKVMAECGKAIMEANKANNARKANTMIWDKFSNKSTEDDGLAGLLHRMGVK